MEKAFDTSGRTSLEQFRRGPDSMRVVTQPFKDDDASKGLVISIQVCGSASVHSERLTWVHSRALNC